MSQNHCWNVPNDVARNETSSKNSEFLPEGQYGTCIFTVEQQIDGCLQIGDISADQFRLVIRLKEAGEDYHLLRKGRNGGDSQLTLTELYEDADESVATPK